MRDKIINECTALFDSKGFKETSIQDIVDNIGVTKGTFYYYFKSKQELLRGIHLSFISDLLKKQEEIINDSNKNSHDKLYDNINLIISKMTTDEGKSARIAFREMRHLEEAHLDEIKTKRKEFRLNLEKLLIEGIAKGELKDTVRPDILSFAILGMANHSYYWYQPDGELTEEELVNLYNEILLNGIKNE